MILTDEEKRMLDGDYGEAVQKSMETLIKYGEALGAEKFVEVNSVAGGIGGSPHIRRFADKFDSMDAVFSEFKINSDKIVKIPKLKAFSMSLTNTMDPQKWKIQNVSEDAYKWGMRCEEYGKTIDMHCTFTCSPYLVGVLPVFGEHCAWMESSAISFCNSVVGARTNTEGLESTGAAALTKRIPYWGLHMKENRYAKHQINCRTEMTDPLDWGLLGYYIGKVAKEKVAVVDGIEAYSNLTRFKQCCAAAASSGGVEMYHVVGKTPEAHTLEMALNYKKPIEVFDFTVEEKRKIYEHLNSAKSENVDFVVVGCPHNSLEEVWEIVSVLDGRKVKVPFWIFIPDGIKSICDRQGYTKLLENSGVTLMTDTCPAMAKAYPIGTKTAATNSAKQAHYFPNITNIGTYYGSTRDCVEAAVTGKWAGEFRG